MCLLYVSIAIVNRQLKGQKMTCVMVKSQNMHLRNNIVRQVLSTSVVSIDYVK